MAKKKAQFPVVARIVVRKGKTAGLFVPFGPAPTAMQEGVWEVRDVLGELTLKFVGKPYMDSARLNGLSLNELVGISSAAMTEAELREAGQLS